MYTLFALLTVIATIPFLVLSFMILKKCLQKEKDLNIARQKRETDNRIAAYLNDVQNTSVQTTLESLDKLKW